MTIDYRLSAKFVIIVAGGSGSRMKSDVPKQFLPIGDKPILQHTLERFLAYQEESHASLHIILVLPARDIDTWTALCEKHDFYPPIQTVTGGTTRFQSVRNGLQAIKTAEGLVAVHDGVRPFITTDLIERGFAIAAETGTAVAAVAAKDSVREVLPDGSSRALDRNRLRLIQTPQTFRLDWMHHAFAQPEQPHYTDCASVLEASGYPITLIEGSYENIKITTPEDLKP
ncbi:2-C-methyl-D-erythritol 4-phosphate cytidylyltransferase [Nibrella saemangeumensis]|uniref:2-C-methyl-D-erythritol 4-phosphate cytidylyltransferase n=1 Tax=Nibrella saemangeumensis TaxID=1084526 RepID=A0ABP8NE51_9BACT